MNWMGWEDILAIAIILIALSGGLLIIGVKELMFIISDMKSEKYDKKEALGRYFKFILPCFVLSVIVFILGCLLWLSAHLSVLN